MYFFASIQATNFVIYDTKAYLMVRFGLTWTLEPLVEPRVRPVVPRRRARSALALWTTSGLREGIVPRRW